MTKKEFEKMVKEAIKTDGARVVDMNTTRDTDGIFANTFMTTVIAVRNHVAYVYNAWELENGNVKVNYRSCLGA